MRCILSLLFLLFSSQALAWWATPHMLVAEIAYQNLNPETRKQVDCLLGESFVESATWADQIRKQGDHQYDTWHYVVLTFSDKNDAMPEALPDEPNVATAITYELVILNDPQQSNPEKTKALKRLIHWVGDIHQPLHATTHIAEEYPQGDRGGNLFKIDERRAYYKLHSYWDSGLLQWPYLPQPLSEKDQKRLSSIAKNLQAQYPKPENMSLTPQAWALESHTLGRQAYENIAYGEKPSQDYIDWGRAVSQQQITLAGYRLAALLNAQRLGPEVCG